MKKKITCLLFAISVLLIGFNVGYLSAQADEMNFSWDVRQSENQRDKTKTYFDLRVTPGQQENLEIELKNTSDEEITILVEANSAVTNDNGVIDYGIREPRLDVTMLHPFAELAQVEPEVTLAPHESKVITVTVDVPEDAFDGIILGGIHLSQKEAQTDANNENGVQIENKFAVVIGVRLSENDDLVTPDLKLLNVAAGQKNYRNVILTNLQNPTPRIISNLNVNADVYAAENTEIPIYHSEQENLTMAPNSNFHYGISTDNKAFKPGKYLLKMTGESKGEVWHFEQEFEIKADEAKKFNDEAVELAGQPKQLTLYLTIGIIVLLILIALLVWLIRSKRKYELELAKLKMEDTEEKNQ